MNVYFYHTQDIQMILRRMEQGEFPPHFLYGATKLPLHGIGVVWHKARLGLPRWRMMLRNTWRILTCHERFDAVYATHYRGIEPLILLRALGLYRHPIVIWHHQPIVTPKSRWREWLGRLFYRGFDHMLFFSQKLIDDSLTTAKARPERMHLGHWGMDPHPGTTADTLPQPRAGKDMRFISTGKEMRDMPTLIEAFNRTGAHLDIYTSRKNGDVNYDDIISRLNPGPNIHIHFPDKLVPHELSLLVAEADCVVVCCQRTKYTVGLTTVVEALALGKPMICSRNPQFPFDIDTEQCGIAVDYYDTEAWTRAILHMQQNPQQAAAMGRASLRLALQRYNDTLCANDVAAILKECL